MGCKELIESLRKVADDKILAVWNEVEREAEKIKGEVSQKVEQTRSEFERKKSAAAGEKIARALSDANSAVRARRLAMEKEVSERLFSLALASLAKLRNSGYPEAFKVMARELPPLPWRTVRVNPGDTALAKKHFPDAEIVSDGTITGGMDAMTEAGKIRVINTFEKRLERTWPDVLPGLIKDVYEKLSKRGTPRGS